FSQTLASAAVNRRAAPILRIPTSRARASREGRFGTAARLGTGLRPGDGGPPRRESQQSYRWVHWMGALGSGLQVVTPLVVQHLLGVLQMQRQVQVPNAALVPSSR